MIDIIKQIKNRIDAVPKNMGFIDLLFNSHAKIVLDELISMNNEHCLK